MWELCVKQLAEITGGRLRFGSLPPLGGDYEPIRRIVLDSRLIRRGDVFWDFDGSSMKTTCYAEEALMRGGLGAVVSGRYIEPWAGRFVLQVENPTAKLIKLIRHCPAAARPTTFVLTEVAAAACRSPKSAWDELNGGSSNDHCTSMN